jgi:hypothetical protein
MSFETSEKAPPVVENKDIDQDGFNVAIVELGIDPNPEVVTKLKFVEATNADDRYVEIPDDVIPSIRLFKHPLIVPAI